MIVEDQFDRRFGWVSGIKKFKKFNEFSATMSILDQSVNLAGEQINSSQQAHRAVALVFVVARKTRVGAGLRRQVRALVGDRLNPGLLVIGDDRHRLVRLLAVGSLL